MSSVSGQLVDVNSGDPVAGVTIQAKDGNGNVMQGVGDISDTDGGYYIDSPLLDNAGTFLSVDDPSGKYNQAVGVPDFFVGKVELYPVQQVSFKIPAWVWILVAVILIAGIMGYLTKLKKLL